MYLIKQLKSFPNEKTFKKDVTYTVVGYVDTEKEATEIIANGSEFVIEKGQVVFEFVSEEILPYKILEFPVDKSLQDKLLGRKSYNFITK